MKTNKLFIILILLVAAATLSGCCNCDKEIAKYDADLAKIRALLEKDELRKQAVDKEKKRAKAINDFYTGKTKTLPPAE